jgi:hypothetical protein
MHSRIRVDSVDDMTLLYTTFIYKIVTYIYEEYYYTLLIGFILLSLTFTFPITSQFYPSYGLCSVSPLIYLDKHPARTGPKYWSIMVAGGPLGTDDCDLVLVAWPGSELLEYTFCIQHLSKTGRKMYNRILPQPLVPTTITQSSYHDVSTHCRTVLSNVFIYWDASD